MLVDEAKAKLSCAIEPTLNIISAPLARPNLKQFPGIISDRYNFQTMNLLQEMDLKAPLPLAMYQCIITCPLTAIVDGYKSNGSVCSLSHANMRPFIRMKDMLEKLRVQLATLLTKPINCTEWGCRYKIHRLWMEDVIGVPPFDPWNSEWNELFCAGCRRFLEEERQRAMDQTWDQFPTAFGFDSWADVTVGMRSLNS